MRTSQEIERELADAESEYKSLFYERRQVEERLKAIESRANELQGQWQRDRGKIPNLRHELAAAKQREHHESSRAVRVDSGYRHLSQQVYSFVKTTAKRIYLSNGCRDEFWELDGTSNYNGTIHPDDLKLILAGETDKLPLVKDVQENHT